MPEYIITNSKGKEKRYSFPTADAAASYLDYARQNNLKVDQVYFDTDNSEQRFPVTKIELDDKGVVHTEVDGDIDRYLTDRNAFTDAGYGFGQKPMSEAYREAYSKGGEPTFEITEGNGARIIEEHDPTRVVPREEYDPARLQRTVQSVQGLGDRMGGVLSDRGISPIDATQPMSKIAGRTSSPIVDKATEYASSEIGGERLSAEDAARMEESPEYRDVYWNIRRKYGMTPEEYATLSVDNINERIEEALDIAEDLREEAIADQSNWYVDIHGNRLNAKDDQIKATIRAIKRAQRDLNDSRTKYGEKDGWHLGKRFWDGGELIAKLTPIYNMISSLESAGVTMGQAMAAGKMIEDPERLTPEQQLLLSLTSIQQSVAQYQQDMGGKHWASGAGEVLQEMPEFMMGMPLAKLATKAVTKVATKGLAKLAGKAIAETAEEATETAAETIARRALDKATGWAKVKQVASDGIGAWGKSFGEAVIGAPTQTLFYRSLADEALGQYQVRPDGSTIQQVTPAWERVYRAWLGTALELHSEDMGMWIGKGLNALGRRMANVGFVRGLMRVPAARSPLMEVVRKELKVADPLSEALGEVYGDAIQPLFTGDLDWSQTLADPDYWLTTVVSSAGVSVAMELPSIMQFKRDADRVNKYGHLMDLSLAVMGEDLRGQLVAAVSHNSIADQTKALANIDWKNVSRQDMAAAMDYVNAYVGRELYYNSYREAERQRVLQEQMNDLLSLSYRSESGYENTMSIIKATAKPSSNLPLGREYYIVGGDYTQYGNLIPVKFIKNGHQEISTVFADQLNIGEPIDIADQLAKQYDLMFGEELAREGVVSISERIAQMRAEGVNEETIREVVSEDPAYHEYKEGDVVTDNQTGEPVTINEQTSTGEYIATKSSGERIAISYDQIADSGAYAEQAIERERTSGGVKEGDVVSFLDRDGEMVEGAVQQILSDGRIYVSVQTGENNGVPTYATQEITPNQIIPAEAQPAQLTPTEQVAEEVAADAAAEVQATEQTVPAEVPIEPQPAEIASTADPRAIPTLEDGSIDYDAIEDPQQFIDLYGKNITSEELVADVTSFRDDAQQNVERLRNEVASAKTPNERKLLRDQINIESNRAAKYQAVLDLLTPATPIAEQTEAVPTTPEVAPIAEEDVEPTAEQPLVDHQGNPIDANGQLIVDIVESVDELSDDDFNNPTRSIQLPKLPKAVDDAIGADGKPIIIKKNIFERNLIRHSDVTPEEGRLILNAALYNPNIYGQNQKERKPYNWVVVSVGGENGSNKLVLLEVNKDRERVEVVHWHFISQHGLEKLKRQAEREDGQLLILPSETSEEVGALSDPTLNQPSESKDTTTEPITQEIEQENLQPTPESTAEEQVEVSPVENEDADKQPALSPDERAAQVEDPNSILFTTMLDNAYRSGDAHRIDYNERFVRALLNRAVNIDGLKRLIQNQTGESSDPEHNAILQRRYAFIREVATSRINDIEAEQTKSETAEPTPRGPVDMNTLQLTMSDEEFNSLVESGDVERMNGYLKELDDTLVINDQSPFKGQQELREEFKRLKEQYGGEDNIPTDVMEDINARYKPYAELSRKVYDRKYVLEDRLRSAEVQATQTAKKEEAEAKETHQITAFNGFLADKTKLGASSAEKALSKKVKIEDKNYTVAEYVEQAVQSGKIELRTSEVPKYKGVSRRKWNQMDTAQQQAEQERIKNGGTVTEYYINDYNLGKTAYDYAQYLQAKAEAQRVAEPEWLQKVPNDGRDFIPYIKVAGANKYSPVNLSTGSIVGLLRASLVKREKLQHLVEELPKLVYDGTYFQIRDTKGKIYYSSEPIESTQGKKKAATKLTTLKTVSGAEVRVPINLYKYVSTDKTRAYTGVYFDPEGFVVATDGHNMIAIKHDVAEADAEKFISKSGDVASTIFNWHIAKPKPNTERLVSIDFSEVEKQIGGKKGNKSVIFNIDGEDVGFPAKAIHALADFQRVFGGEVFIGDMTAGKAIMISSGDNYAMVLQQIGYADPSQAVRIPIEGLEPAAPAAEDTPAIVESIESTAVETPTEPTPKKSKAKAKSSEDKIEDFGEKIGGARKDVARARLRDAAKLSIKDLEVIKDPDKILSRKAIVKYVQEGVMTNQDAISLLALNMVARQSGAKGMLMDKYRSAALQWERGENIEVLITEQDIEARLNALPERARALPNARERIIKDLEFLLLNPYNDYKATYEALDYPSIYRDLKGVFVRYGEFSQRYYVVRNISATRGWSFSTMREAIKRIQRDYPPVEFEKEKTKTTSTNKEDRIGNIKVVKDDRGYYRLKSKNIPGNIYLSGRLYSKSEAEKYLQDNAEMLIEREAKMTEALMGSNIGMVERVGVDYRNGRDITPEEFQSTFGFRGVEFGNWVPQAERQMYLNKSYDAIKDFCAIVGISPKAFSLGGRLGLAFGARGKSGALAHYEPMKEVINLTRMKGAGSLAHEWFHALDNYIARSKSGDVTGMATERFDAVRQELSDVFRRLVSKMNTLAYSNRSKNAGDYWGEVTERVARLFQNYIYNRLATEEVTSPLLVRKDALFDETGQEVEDFVKSTWPYPSERENEEMKPYFDELFSTLQEKVDEQGNVVLFQRGDFPEMPNTEANRRAYKLIREKLRKKGIEVHEVSEEMARQMAEAVGAEYQIVYHGSGAKFDRFDHSFMGTGEGAQAYGWGTYVTQVEGIGKAYAEQISYKNNEQLQTLQYQLDILDGNIAREKEDLEWHIKHTTSIDKWLSEAQGEYDNFAKEADRLKTEFGEESPEFRNYIFYDYQADELAKAKRSKADNTETIAFKRDRIATLEYDRNKLAQDIANWTPPTAHLYSVDIPESNGEYLQWEREYNVVELDKIVERLNGYGIGDFINEDSDSIAGSKIYETVSLLENGDKSASELLSKAGFVGIEYPAQYQSGGRADNAKNYVIFNENNLKIIDRVELFQDAAGKIYGWAVGGEIYLTPDGLNANTAIHEYSHLWVEVLRKKDSKKWGEIKSQLKATPFWQQVIDDPNYERIRENEDAVASEVLARLTGKNGAERLATEAQRIIDAGNGSLSARIEATALVQRVKRLLRDLWAWVARNIFGVTNEATISQLSDMVVDDLLDETPLTDTENSPFEAMFIGELGANVLDIEQRVSYRMANMDVAMQMEQAGKSPFDIKIATGWERGADGEWRYEISDAEAHLNIEAMAELNQRLDSGVRQRNADKLRQFEQNNPSLAKKRQEMIEKYSINSSAVEALDEVFELTPVVAEFKLRDLFDYDEAYEAYPQLMNTRVRVIDGMRSLGAHWGDNIDISLEVAQIPARMRATLLHEIQHSIQSIEGFAAGGNKEVAQELMREMEQEVLIFDFAGLVRGELQENPDLTDRQVAQKVISELKERTGLTREELESTKRIPATKQRAEALAAARNPELYEYYWGVFQMFNAALDDEGNIDSMKAYRNLMGEVEARNTTSRRNMTAEQRRSSLGSTTEDVNRGVQIYRSRQGDDSESLAEESKYSSRAEALSAVAHDVAAKLNAPIRVITDMNDVPRARQSWKGWWQRGESGEQIVVVVPNNIDAADIERTILHEAVAHYGLRKLLGESQFNLLLDTVLKSMSEEEVQQRMRKYGTNDPMVVADEYIAEVAEGNVTPSMFERVVSAVRAFLRDVLGLSVQMTDNDIRYLLWQSKNALEGKSAFGRAMVMAQGKPLADIVAEEYGYARAYTAEEQQIIDDAQRDGTYLKAPNGRPTNLTPKQWVQVRTKAFKRWFGDWAGNLDNASKIVDANGEPLVVWHGGSFAINDFTPNGTMHFGTKVAALQRVLDQNWGYGNWEVIRNADGTWGWKYTDPDAGEYKDEDYSRQSDKYFTSPIEALEDATESMFDYVVRPYFLNIRNEERVDDMQDDDGWDNAVSNAIEMGSDGLVYSNDYEDEGNDSFVAFYPTQIKSAEINSGEFDPTDPDIRARRKDFLDAEGKPTKATPMKQAKEVKPKREFRANNLFGRFFETFWRYTGASQVVAGKTIDGLVIKAGEKELARRIEKGEELLRKREAPFVSAFVKKKIGKGDAMAAFQKLSKADKLQLSKVITGFNPVVDYMSAENRSESQGEYALKKYFDGFIAPLNESRRRMREVMGISDQELETYVSGESSLERHNSGTDALSTDETKAWSLKKVEGIVTRFRSRLRNNMELQLKQQGANALSEAEKELLGEDLIKKLTEEGYDSLSAGEQMAVCEAPVEVLWERIRALNNEHLNILLRAGRYSHDDIERIKSHDWRYYVPMFKQDLNVEGLIDPAAVYDVDVFYGTPSAPSLKPALGRDTKSQDVFRSMYQLGQRCVVFEVRNRVARSLYDFTIWANDHLGLFETRKYWHEGITYQTKTASGKWVDEDTMPSREEREQMLATQREIAALNRERLDISRQINRLSSQIEEVHSEQAADLIDDALRGLVNRKEEILDKIVKLEADRKWRAKKSNFDFEDPTSAQAIEPNRTVRVWIDGREHRMVFADLDIARAVNGNKNGIVKAIEWFGRLVGPFTRFRAQMNTQYSPDFIVSNTLRDYQHALLAMALAEQGDITLSFAGNYFRHLGDMFRSRGINYNPLSEAELEGRIPYYSYERMRSAYIAAKVRGEQITEEEFDRDYRDWVSLNRQYLEDTYGKARVRDTFIDAFQRYGGATGFIHQLNSKQIEKQLREAMLLKEDVLARRYVDPTTPFRLIRDVISRVSESMEDITRFATFMAHLDHGASVERAAQEAKEVTTNFNRRGELATGLGSLYMFFNASVQGSAQVMRLIKQHPRRAVVVLPLYALLGFMQRITRGMLWKIGAATGIKAFFFDDDDEERPRTEDQLEKEKAIRDYMYSDNLIIVLDRTLDAADTALDGIYLRIPQPNGFRAAYKVGVELAEVAMGEQRWDELPESLISTLAGEFVYGFGDTGELTSDMWRMVIPSAVQPISDLLLNKDFVNRTIYNEREYNPIAPAYTVAKSNTPSLYVDASRILNSVLGTDTRSADYNERYEKRAIGLDVPPEAIKYLVGEMFGGVGTFANRMWTTVELMTDGEKGNLAKRDIPFVNRVIGEFEPENVWPKYKSLTDQIEAAWSESSGFRAEQGIDMRKSEWKNPDVTYPYLIEHYKDNPYAVEMLRKRWLLGPYFKEIEDYTESLKRLGEGASSSDRASESRDMSSEAEIHEASRTLTEKFILELSKHVDWQAATNEEVIEQVEQITGEIKGKNQ